jgi:pSer/pThr/pTyr-binding forkhead associated (FHA) protein
MKALSIGREQGCDIVINDSTDVISRRHAILNISSSGKITIVDQSRNGTYVNGIRISQNVPVPVTRKDIISFAHVAKLDWNAVPKSNSTMSYIIMGIVGVLVITCGLFAYQYMKPGDSDSNKGEVTVTDTIANKKEEVKKDSTSIKKEPKELAKDSVVNKKQKSKEKEKKKKVEEKTPKPVAPSLSRIKVIFMINLLLFMSFQLL